jgi:hypothetical protein
VAVRAERDRRAALGYRLRYWGRRRGTALVRTTERLVAGAPGARVPTRPLALRPDATDAEVIHPRNPDVVVRFGSPDGLPDWMPREAAVAATWTYSLRGTTVDPESGAVWLRDGTPLPELCGGVSRYSGGQDVRGLARRRARERLSGTWALLPNHTYYHFLVEDLPALLVSVAIARGTFALDPGILTTRERHRYVSDAIGTLGARVHETSHSKVSVERIVASGFETSQVHPSSLDVLRRHFDVDEEPGDRVLYVSRAGFRRSPAWEGDLVRELTRRLPGLEVVDGHRMSLREQVATFREAAVVIGPHGAGLTNLVFSPRTTRVIEIATPRNRGDHFWRLSALRGQSYRQVSVSDDDGPGVTAERIRAAAGRGD